jgi:hypothetical protein
MPREFGYGLCPLWSWNGRPTRAGIRDGADWMDELGFEGYFLHPRPGVKTKFVSEAWVERAQDAVNAAADRGMDVWLYDEDSYPSGFAGGQLLDGAPERRARGLRYERVASWGDRPEAMADAPLARTFAIEEGDPPTYEPAEEDAETDADADAYLCFWVAFAPDRPRYNGHSYVDTRDPETTERFLDIVYERYADALGEQFGAEVVGVFTDEPNGAHHLKERALMWTAGFPETFREEKGYDLLERLPALVLDADDAAAVRFDYYDLLNELLVSNFTRRIDEWCRERDLHFTGHFWEHAWPDLSHTAAIMPHYAEMSVPGVDCLFRPDAENPQYGNELMVRELDSVARQFGRRAMCETWGGAGWSVTRTDLKRMADWLLALGVDFFVPHFVHDSLEGLRKRDWPPSYGEHLDGATALTPLFESMAETAAWIDAGERATSVAVLHPSTTVWTAWTPADGGDVPAGRDFRAFVADLESAGVGFDLLDETILRSYGAVGEDGVRVGDVTYETVVVPAAADTVRAETRDALAASGVEVLYLGSAPTRVDGRLADADLAAEWDAERVDPAALRERLEAETPITHDSSRALRTRTTRVDGEWRCFLVNTADERQSVRVRAPADASAAIATDRFEGTERRVDAESVDSGVVCELALRPYQSLCLTFHAGTPAPDPSPAASAANPDGADAPARLEPGAVHATRDAPNVAVLDFCDLDLGGETRAGEYVLAAQDAIFEAHGIDYASRPFEVRHWWRLVAAGAKRRRASGFEATFRFAVADPPDGPVAAVVENAPAFDVALNGEPLAFDRGSWLDDAFRCADATPHLRTGVNELVVGADRVSIEHALEPVYLRGDVSVDAADPTRPTLEPDDSLGLGSLPEQGHPFYVGWVTYEGTVDYDPEWGAYALDAGTFDGLAATARVNGERVGPIGEPAVCGDVTHALVAGENEIAVSVYVGPENALGPLHHEDTPREAGLAHPGMFTPHGGESFRAEHRVGPAGLHEPFALERIDRQ